MTSAESNSYRTLEWDRLLGFACAEALTEPGRECIQMLYDPKNWASDIHLARLMQQETQEIIPLLDRDALWGPLFELRDPALSLERLAREDGVLEVEEFATLRRWLYAVDSWTQTPREEIRGERFKKDLLHLPDPLSLLRVLDRILTPSGELSDQASSKLAALNSEIRSLKREIGSVLDHLLKTFSQKGILQENFTDVRDGRYVLPIKISSQNEVDGIVYEASASRQTVFVEPKEVASLNNRLRQKQNDLIQEIFVILDQTSKTLRPYVDEIRLGIEILSRWDCIHAKARLSQHYAGKPIRVTEERYFSLHQTAHPLLWWSMPAESIIRNEINFGQPARSLLLTGPNTGGKTVLLKTLGLAGICARTGFAFPAVEVPTVPFFDTFFADLGDPQSIEQHLSSFSGHAMRFKEILENLTEQSLILIDELNSATDPEEGAAFGRAVLETIMSRNAMVITTTHDPRLKALAVSDQRILNASMAFDESSRTPTYQMVIGVPGRSRALETAERLGIPLEVIQLARTYLSKEHLEFESMLSKLDNDVREASRARKEAVWLREEAERLKKEWTQRTEGSVHEMLERTRQKLRRVAEQAQDEVRGLVKSLEEMKNYREVSKTRQTLSEVLERATTQLDLTLGEEAPEVASLIAQKKPPLVNPDTPSKPKVVVGTTVRVPKWKSIGTVLAITGNRVKISMGTLQINLLLDEVVPIAEPLKTHHHSSQTHSQSAARVEPKIDLRGERFEDAMAYLEQYLDLAYRTESYVEVTVVHGLGTGALREGSHKLLRKLPYIKSFRDGGAGNGGTGATIVEFELLVKSK